MSDVEAHEKPAGHGSQVSMPSRLYSVEAHPLTVAVESVPLTVQDEPAGQGMQLASPAEAT